MSEEAATTDVVEEATAKNSPLMLIAAVAAGVVALMAVISFVLLLVIRSDVSLLDDQVRKLSKTVKGMEEELALVKTAAQAAATRAPAAASAPGVPTTVAPPRPTHIDAGDATQDCVIRPGSKNPLANCLK